MVAVALSIAGSDPSGGAGIQADLKTFHAHGVYGEAVVALLTGQSSRGVSWSEPLDPEWVLRQLDPVLQDMPPAAVKLGALGRPDTVRAVAERLAARPAVPWVVDPVLAASSGASFADGATRDALVQALLPGAALVTPNAPEAEALTGLTVRDLQGAERAGRALLGTGVGAVLVKGGHLQGEPVDVLCTREQTLQLRARRVQTRHTHGTGCTYSAAIAAQLAKGVSLVSAVQRAHAWLHRVLEAPLGLGAGRGPLNHFVPVG